MPGSRQISEIRNDFIAPTSPRLAEDSLSRDFPYGPAHDRRGPLISDHLSYPRSFKPFLTSPRTYVPLYQRSQIGFNVHNRGDYTVGSYRLFELAGNGVMQISDGGKYLDTFFTVGEEIAGYTDPDDLIEKLRYYLRHDEERQRFALNGYRRVMKDHRLRDRMRQAGELIEKGMGRVDWRRK